MATSDHNEGRILYVQNCVSSILAIISVYFVYYSPEVNGSIMNMSYMRQIVVYSLLFVQLSVISWLFSMVLINIILIVQKKSPLYYNIDHYFDWLLKVVCLIVILLFLWGLKYLVYDMNVMQNFGGILLLTAPFWLYCIAAILLGF